MKLGEAKAGFTASLQQRRFELNGVEDFEKVITEVFALLESRFTDLAVEQITPARLRDFLARWYVEEASAKILQPTPPSASPVPQPSGRPETTTLIKVLSAFFTWLRELSPDNFGEEHLAILNELQKPLLRAVAINVALSRHLASCGGAVNFPEFLTSFEAGGHSEYDIGTGGAVGAIEGYFRILHIEGVKVEAEELLSEMRIYPIIFPTVVAELLQTGYLINLEIVHTSEAWQIVNCGFAYPPNTEI